VEHIRTFSSPGFAGNGLAERADDIRERLASALRLVDQVAAVPVSRLPGQPVTERDITAVLKYRRNRDRFFEGELFADPAWDILLELYAAMLGQRRISVGSLCLGAAVPATTALRWISLLEKKGLIGRNPDPMDGRRYHLSLTGAGAEAMASYFRTVPNAAPVL
jgi:DNA-binding MarR family transcriptional regulator